MILPSSSTTTLLHATALHASPRATVDAPVRKQKQRGAATVLQDYNDELDSGGVVQLVKPRKRSSKEKRREALKAMGSNGNSRMEAALNGVDAQVLELLSEQFLYPKDGVASAAVAATTNEKKIGANRPKGRPDYVPGAMKYETMVKFQEKERLRRSRNNSAAVASAVFAPYAATGLERNSVSVVTEEEIANTGTSQRVKGAKRSTKSEVDETSSPDSKGKKKRKRVHKSLPDPKRNKSKGGEKEKSRMVTFSRTGGGGNGMDLQKYYRTDLLTADEEYSLGMKIQFMMKCELVHEGLATKMKRLPTMVEWAAACGFTEVDASFYATEGDEQLRPPGYETMFEKMDPNQFVGNGLAHSAGPGRGRGRAKKPPPLTLKPYYDDSEVQALKRAGRTDSKELKQMRKELQPVNRGTAKDFVELMMTGRESKQRMVQSNMRLVVSIARKYANVGVNLQDLVQEGSLGLSRAAEKFEPERGFKFSTYASWWIQQAVFRSIAYHSRTIRLPVHVHNLLNRVRKVRDSLQRDLGRAPTNEEMADELDMPLKKYNKMIRLTRRSLSLETPKYKQNPKDMNQESEDVLGDSIQDENTPEKSVNRGLFHDDIKEMLKILDTDERTVICARYGLSDGLTRTVTAVAAQMKQSKAWVRSQECRALRKLRRPWYEKKLKDHQDALTT